MYLYGREQQLACDSFVSVTARLPNEELGLALRARAGEAGAPTLRVIGDAWSPGTIAAAVWEGHRFAEELGRSPLKRRSAAVPARGDRAGKRRLMTVDG